MQLEFIQAKVKVCYYLAKTKSTVLYYDVYATYL
jgi:hypothetical protein